MTERPNSASTNGLRSAHLGPPPPPPPRGDERPNASDSGRLSVSPPTGGAPPSESDEEPGEWSSEKSPEPSEGRDSGRMDSGDFGQSPPSAYRTTSLDSYKGREHRERSRGPDRDRDYRHRDFDRERGRDRDRERDRERERERERARRYDGGDRARDRRYEGHRDRPRDYDRNGSSRHGHSDLYREREREHPPSRRRASGYDRDESLSGHGSGGAALQSPGTTGWSSSTTPHHASSRYHSRRSRSPRDYTSGSSRPTSPHRLAMDRHHPFSYIGDNRRFSTTPPQPP
ncbi:hypothetical protein BJ085DRAFT_34797 [Dimargaris cristalligena]|uniref:Uncharacterized protein n=1 Tax=Dimargaris cristalligena TaxID=215637 RepID=A0A4P9ZLG1_9FUNG|nr:hypothetical protein BJ085DRAFT_34797 [Dimargaris cristalligena]|eukprot:RKP33422.1 hypothetical protein BJ085DRAFT_34797 [Dimargaris cristalligena]